MGFTEKNFFFRGEGVYKLKQGGGAGGWIVSRFKGRRRPGKKERVFSTLFWKTRCMP